jgi:uncharacterized protein (DUF488 family)
VNILTVGFTKKSAREFFSLLETAGATRLIDVRLNNVSQLAGFTKRTDLKYFTDRILGIPYLHIPALAPTKEMLDTYRKVTHDWQRYEHEFLALMAARAVDKEFAQELLSDACLLCTEPTADRCHRRLVAEYLRDKWGDVSIRHL